MQQELEEVQAQANALHIEGQERVAEYKQLRKDLLLAEDAYYPLVSSGTCTHCT